VEEHIKRITLCPVCGGDKFTWGITRGYGPSAFLADTAGAVKKFFSIGEKMKARKCDSCKNIQLFTVE
jgi:hypothetical protein